MGAGVTALDPIYLDYNATTPVLPEVLEAMLPYLRAHFGNPSSAHVLGRRAREAVERARGQIASLIGCAADEIVLTSGGTESNNLAIRGVAAARTDRTDVVTTVIEHPATERPCGALERSGARVTRLGVDADGKVEIDRARAAIDARTSLVTVMLANNETGVLQPVAEIAAHARACGAIVHTDAAQAVGKVPVNAGALGVDLLSIAGHKLYAPKGVGALYLQRGTPIVPFVLGASHERGLRPGTENVASIVGLGAACEIAARDLEAEAARVGALRDELWELLRNDVAGAALNGHAQLRLPNTLHVRFPGVSATALLGEAPEIAASAGSACHEGSETPSSVLTAMGIAPAAAMGSVRLSLGRGSTKGDIARAAAALSRAWRAVSARRAS